MNDIYLKFAMKPMMIERRSFEWLAAHMVSNKALKLTKPSLAHGGSNNIAIIPIHGILTKRSGIFDGMLGMTSYDEIQQQISAALLDDTVQTILLDIDSPGGETSGLFDLADFIFNARSQKRIWAVCNDEAYSAAYGIASSAEKVFINRTSGAGSIGVIATHMDQSAFDEKQGVKYTTVFAGNRKNDLNPHEPLTSESMQTLQSEVSRLYDMFVELVARNRGLTTEAVKATEAGLYFGLDAIQTGLADEILTFPECIQKAATQSFIRTIAMTETLPTINPEELLTQGKIQGRSEYQAEALELFRLCKLSKMPEKLGDFIEQNTPVNEAREQLMQLLADRTGTEILSTVSLEPTPQENPVIQAAKARSGHLKLTA
ncbi:MAG: S49 family peptidase [Acinetobacter sp.]|uniref:S49 family peptidase n=1 Tax=Acinetobacter sp. TaxID=472 RepID=UPI000F98F61D|nr:S49 family peptidase [Acinetobacter sp.]RUP42070.1 MAG: S49 family peptidase [Acinetobacter sp.]